MLSYTERFIKWFVSKNFISVRSGMLYAAVWMTIDAGRWATHFASTTILTDGVAIGLIIAAATTPAMTFTAFVYNQYTKSRKES